MLASDQIVPMLQRGNACWDALRPGSGAVQAAGPDTEHGKYRAHKNARRGIPGRAWVLLCGLLTQFHQQGVQAAYIAAWILQGFASGECGLVEEDVGEVSKARLILLLVELVQ